MTERNIIFTGNALVELPKLQSKIANTCVTSPPYYGLRDNEHQDQIGLEETPELYINNIVRVFNQVHRVLKDDGTLWLNLGDSYWGGKGMSGAQSPEAADARNEFGKALTKKYQQIGGANKIRPTDRKHPAIKPKDMVGIPWRAALALQGFAVVPFVSFSKWADELRWAIDNHDWESVKIVEQKLRFMDLLSALQMKGWYLRQDIIWSKPNPMPESMTDRCTRSHEYIFLLTKSKKYYFDQAAIAQPLATSTVLRMAQDVKKQNGSPTPNMKAVADGLTANKRDVWEVAAAAYDGAHFSTYPQELIVDCIKAGSPVGGLVLDPFMGSGTTAVVARKLNRDFIGCELNPKNAQLAEHRLHEELGMFK